MTGWLSSLKAMSLFSPFFSKAVADEICNFTVATERFKIETSLYYYCEYVL